MNKKFLRQHLKKQLQELNRDIYQDYSTKIVKNLERSPVWKSSQTIGITISHFPEVDTWEIIRKGWKAGKDIAVPKCYPQERRLEFFKITSFSQLENVYLHLYEPNVDVTYSLAKQEIDLLIVPGLGFTRKGYRLGFGGGYYDRFLTDYSGQTVSLAFSCQILEQIPVEDYDLPVQTIITENGMINCNP